MKIVYIVIAVLVVLFLCIVAIGNSVKASAPYISESIEESKEVDAFILEYDIKWFSPSLIDSLSKHRLDYIDLTKQEYWVERSWRLEYDFIFFEKVHYLPQLRFLITDPTSLNGKNPGPPFILFKIKDTHKSSASNGVGGAVCLFEVDSIMDEVNLEIFLKMNHSSEKYMGDLLLNRSPGTL